MDQLRYLAQALPAQALPAPGDKTFVAAAATGAALYLVLMRLLRFRRRDEIVRGHGKRPLASMTVDEAYEIHKKLANLEFPETVKTSLFFALFKTYAIPSISSLLLATGQLASDSTASKRAADTSAIITEVTQASRTSDRLFESVARMNYLHSRYRKAGKISDDDMLYTLSLFALEPSRWVTRMDWREFTDVELCAEGVLWRDVGESMEIPFDALVPYFEGGAAKEHDGLTWLRALEEWSVQYEAAHAVPDETNRKVAKGTLDILLFNVPVVLRTFFTGVISAVLDDRTRAAMKLHEPSLLHRAVAGTLFATRRLTLGYLSPPRPSWLPVKRLEENKDPVTGKYFAHIYFAHPWYIKPTFASRWGPLALCMRLLGGFIPEEGSQFFPDGYHIAELGPEKMIGKGHEEMEDTKRWLRERRGMGGCPMAVL